MKKVFKSSMSNSRTSSRDTTLNLVQPQSRIEISHFWGAEDYIEARDWIELYDTIATDYGWTATNKVIRLGGYLRKHALVWYIQTTKVYPAEITQWNVIKDLFKKRFSPVNIPLEKSSSRSAASSVPSSSRQ